MDSRTQESQRGRNGLSWFRPINALRPAADDPYIKEHPKSGGTTECKGERERFGRGSLGVDSRVTSPPVEPSPSSERRKMAEW